MEWLLLSFVTYDLQHVNKQHLYSTEKWYR